MLKKISIYYFLIAIMAIGYLPPYFRKKHISIPIGHVDIYLIDICLVVLIVTYLVSAMMGRNRTPSRKSEPLLWLFFALYLLIFVKVLVQSSMDTATIRLWLNFSAGYIFLILFPWSMTSMEDLRKILILGCGFALYMALLHIYNFSVHGYKLHVLGGDSLRLLGLVYFLLIVGQRFFRINVVLSYAIKITILAVYFMVGHRSGFIALLLGLMVLFFLKEKRTFFLEVTIVSSISIVLLVSALIFAPRVTDEMIARAKTTFDTSQQTYQDRYHNIFTTITYATHERFFGHPLDINYTRYLVTEKEKRNGIEFKEKVRGLVPHNLLLEWLYFFGWGGFAIGMGILWSSSRLFRRFLKEYRGDPDIYRVGIGLLCVWIHNLFWANSNTNCSNIYNIFFLYLPLVIIISISRLSTPAPAIVRAEPAWRG